MYTSLGRDTYLSAGKIWSFSWCLSIDTCIACYGQKI